MKRPFRSRRPIGPFVRSSNHTDAKKSAKDKYDKVYDNHPIGKDIKAVAYNGFTVSSQDVYRSIGLSLIEDVIDSSEVSIQTPSTVAASTYYYLCLTADHCSKSQKDVGELFGVSDTSIRKYYKDIRMVSIRTGDSPEL